MFGHSRYLQEDAWHAPAECRRAPPHQHSSSSEICFRHAILIAKSLPPPSLDMHHLRPDRAGSPGKPPAVEYTLRNDQ